MDYQKYFSQLKQKLGLEVDAKLQAAYQYGVQADELAQLVIRGLRRLLRAGMICIEKMNHSRKLVPMI